MGSEEVVETEGGETSEPMLAVAAMVTEAFKNAMAEVRDDNEARDKKKDKAFAKQLSAVAKKFKTAGDNQPKEPMKPWSARNVRTLEKQVSSKGKSAAGSKFFGRNYVPCPGKSECRI
jgi:hypothetical protein